MSCSGSHLGITINIKNTTFVKDLPMIDAEFSFNQCNSLREESLRQLKPNCPGMIIGRSSVFYADRKSKMAATTGHCINTGPYGENTEIYSSLRLLH
jgi:hypothetical protein